MSRNAPASSRAPCAACRMCGCATSRPSAAISPMAIPTWTCRRCLMALDASIVVTGRGGERTLKVENLFAGYYETVLAPGELITELRVPAQGARRAAYLKVTTGAADDWPALGVAVSFEANGKTLSDVRVVASAATEKAIRLTAAEQVLAGATIDDHVLARAGDAAADDSGDGVGRARLGALQARVAARLCAPRGAPGARRHQRSEPLMATISATTTTGGQVGRSPPRLEAREKVTGRAEYTHNLRLPGMLFGKIFRTTVAHGRIKLDRHQRREGGAGRLPGRHVGRRAQGHPAPLLRPGVPRPADPRDRQGALRRRAGRRGARRGSPCRRPGRGADRRRIRRAAGGVRRGRGGARTRSWCTRSSSPPAPSPT